MLILTLVLAACSSPDQVPSGNIAASDDISVTLHDYQDERPDADRFSASFTLTNTSKLPAARQFEKLICILQDHLKSIVAYMYCDTPGLLPEESLQHDLSFYTLSPATAERLLIIDRVTGETLASFDLERGIAAGSTSDIDAETYANERYQGSYFQSAEEWNRKIDQWRARRPPFPDPIASVRGIVVASQIGDAIRQDRAIRNDKWVHCVLGAEIARATDLKTAEFAGWLKEQQDLTDGQSNTGFDEGDFEATMDGARQDDMSRLADISGIGTRTPLTDLRDICDDRWGDRYSRWDGTIPPP